uniref:Uncharacterized protein n=1 Tax=Monopterus albus TaxID=43700 RepID=A0A3Q3JYZ5_MONAL
MTSVGSPLIPAAAEATGLAPAVIENWIGNYKRSLKAPSDRRPRKPKLHTRELSAYNLFCRDLLRNKGTLRDIKPRWSSLGEEQKNNYLEEAAALKAEGKTQHLSPEMRELKVKKHLKQLKLEVSSLEALGVETAVLSLDRLKADSEVHKVSSRGAAGFLDSADTVNSFAMHFKGAHRSASTTKEPVSVMVKRVQELFNQKYKEAGGDGRLPYQSLLNQSITIHVAGLPNGITLKKPSFYGRLQLEEILKAAEQISFQIGPLDPVTCSLCVVDSSDICCVCYTHFNNDKKNSHTTVAHEAILQPQLALGTSSAQQTFLTFLPTIHPQSCFPSYLYSHLIMIIITFIWPSMLHTRNLFPVQN